MLLQTLLAEAKSDRRQLKLAIIDVAKAFDSVTHRHLREQLRAGVDEKLGRYIMDGYSRHETVLEKARCTRRIKPATGGGQSNPLSPVLFNLVVDEVLMSLPEITGFKLGNAKVGNLAYADDIVLLAESEPGLQD